MCCQGLFRCNRNNWFIECSYTLQNALILYWVSFSCRGLVLWYLHLERYIKQSVFLVVSTLRTMTEQYGICLVVSTLRTMTEQYGICLQTVPRTQWTFLVGYCNTCFLQQWISYNIRQTTSFIFEMFKSQRNYESLHLFDQFLKAIYDKGSKYF